VGFSLKSLNPFRAVKKVVKAVVNVATSVIGEVISWVIDIPGAPDIPDTNAEARGALVNKQSNIEQIPVIYGTRRVGGTIVFVETSGGSNK